MQHRTTTKQKLLNVLKRLHDSSMKEIMVHFSISEVAVRRHLAELIRQDFIKERIVKQEIGRPYHIYTLTVRGHGTFPNQYEQLSVELLDDLEALQGREAVQAVLLRRKIREEAEIASLIAGEDFDGKIQKIVEHQNKKGYMIEYEQKEDGNYEMKNYNCPIYNLASSYREICRNEKEMLSAVLDDSGVVSESCMTSGGNYCCWVIEKTS